MIENHVEIPRLLIENFRVPFIQHRDEMYASAIKSAGLLLENWVGLIDCTRIQMSRPGVISAKQRAAYSDHKQ